MDFNTFCQAATISTAVLLILAGLCLKTKNFKSTVLFKVIPFFFGMCNLYIGLRLMSLIQRDKMYRLYLTLFGHHYYEEFMSTDMAISKAKKLGHDIIVVETDSDEHICHVSVSGVNYYSKY